MTTSYRRLLPKLQAEYYRILRYEIKSSWVRVMPVTS